MQPSNPPNWRQTSIAPRRAPPVPGPLDDPVTRNKMSSRCFWNACKALSFGLLLMIIGTAMATIGYYADQLSTVPEVRSNTTGTVTLKSRGFHLHNLSYAGPIVMGVGGFIVVAACVMTFEARDSAAKVVPTRLKYSTSHAHRHSKLSPATSSKFHSSVRTDSRRNTTKWDQTALYRSQAAGGGSPAASEALNRRALTAAFIQFSRNLQQGNTTVPIQPTISKSPSAPNLAEAKLPTPTISPFLKSRVSPQQRQRRSRNSLRPSGSGCTLLNPHALLQRQALSMDNPDYNPYFSPPHSQQLSRQHSHSGKGSKESIEVDFTAVCQAHGSQASMAMDLHLPNDCPVTLRVRDRTKRSDTAKRHAFVRQSQIVDDDDQDVRRETHSCSPRLPAYHENQLQARSYDEIKPYSRSTPHSRRESLTKGTSTRPNTEDPPRSRSNTSESRRSSLSKRRYSRTNTDEKRRRGSTTSDQRRESNISRSSSYEKRQHYLEPQSSTCSGRSVDVYSYESGCEHNPEEVDRRSETFVVIEEVDVQLPTVSCSGVEETEFISSNVNKPADDT